jgi:cytidine deaminase
LLTNEELIMSAARILKPRATTGGRLIGDNAATLLTDKGNAYSGVCIDTGSGTGFCAEHSAMAAMVTFGEYRIARIVAVWRDERNGKLYVLPLCGRCREFMRQIDEANLETQVVLGRNRSMKLKELLPYHEWPEPLEP